MITSTNCELFYIFYNLNMKTNTLLTTINKSRRSQATSSNTNCYETCHTSPFDKSYLKKNFKINQTQKTSLRKEQKAKSKMMNYFITQLTTNKKGENKENRKETPEIKKRVETSIRESNTLMNEHKDCKYRKKCKQLESLVIKLEKQLDKSNIVIPDLVNKISILQSDLSEKEKENEQIKNQMNFDDKDKLIQIQNSKIDNLERELKEMKLIFLQKGIQFEKEIKQCKDEISKKDSYIRELQDELKRLQTNV